ncbi:protein kinase domain-containing protein [Pyxidicoccus sp. MSG2]|uniref:protein kinase domain-containing protein n=1 Tax=Pyxidicoccus sp. MSG2 TaxID=2996790 RepID=UPI00226FB30D|nr:protein kinase [Pyxidicoccus sp. MSG2]MCY1023798.1 protein kinase [Pyxidicoccus sp. MSG2]
MSASEKERLALDPTLPPESLDSLRPSPVGEHEARSGETPEFPVSHWERYEFIEPLGRGGMGEVYKARDLRLGRVVALKFIRGAHPDRVMRLLREARAQARIDHPNICKVYEVGEVGAKAYIAMQLVGGQRVDQAPMSVPEKVRVMKEVTEAIHEAHRLGVIHRDLKPANILVSSGEDGRWLPVVLDFGLAYEVDQGHGLTETGAVMGTPAYMAPEQARGDVRSIDRRTDVYGLGATLYELLAGVPPFTDPTLMGTLTKVLHEEPPPPRMRVPQLASDLETLVLKCLSKEPDLRYPSARALAEDLGRYLDGEPILGQRPGLLYRLKRGARRHRALVAISALSLVSILVLSAFGVRSWLEARHTREQSAGRALLAEQLGQQVKDLEYFLRVAHGLPLHDTTREQQHVHALMERMAAREHALGEAGEGLVQYALGRGHLAMLDFEKAHEALTKAWGLGIDTRELHLARGRVLGELYHRAMEDARRSGGAEWLAGRQRELEKQYLEPALQSLERSQGLALESPRYLEGLIAFYRRDYDAAARAAAEATAEAPWDYEALKLAADIEYTRAMELLERGEYDAARSRLQAAVGQYEHAAESGRSDARIHEALAEAWLQQSELDQRQGRPPQEALRRALEAGGRALKAAPLRASGYTRQAQVLLKRYHLNRFQGGSEDPAPILAEWIATATRAVELDSSDVYAYDSLGNGLFLRGFQEARDGRDPGPAWEEAISALRKALALQPRYPWGLNDLALVYRWKGNHQREHGQDPRDAFAEAERYFRQAIQVDPRYLYAFQNLGDLYDDQAAHALAHGQDPEAEIQKALQVGQQALSIDGRFYLVLNQVAAAELTRAQYLLDSGGAPRPALERAFQHLARSLGINATFGRTYFHRARGHLVAAEHALGEARNPDGDLQAGRRALVEAYRNDAGCVDCRVVSARLSMVEAAWAKRRGRPGVPLLQQALAEARQAVELYPYYEAHQELARVYWHLAEEQPASAALESIARGEEQVGLALKLDPALAQAHAIRGGLLLTRARLERQAATRMETLRQARAALVRAVELNPLLRREYEEPLREVEQRLSQP